MRRGLAVSRWGGAAWPPDIAAALPDFLFSRAGASGMILGEEEAMNSDKQTPKPESASPPNGSADDPRREVEELRQAVKRLEAEKEEYRKSLYAVLRAQFTEKDVVIPEEKDCRTFDEFVHELEEIVNGGGGAK